MSAIEPLLSVRGLAVAPEPDERGAAAPPLLEDVSLELGRGQVLALLGPGGSGKSLTALAIMRLLPPPLQQRAGEVWFDGSTLSALSDAELRRVRGRKMAMVFQEPALALSPVHTVGWQLGAALEATAQIEPGLPLRRRGARARARELLARVELPDAEQLLEAHIHQLSAGMRRRVSIAIALAGNPALLIADEPTTGLDPSIQAQILDLLARLSRRDGMSVLLITHDLSVAAELASDIAVLYAGQIVEAGPATALLRRAQHPYTRLLLARERQLAERGARRAWRAPAGGARQPERAAPAPLVASGCRYSEVCAERQRSPERHPRCSLETPPLGPAQARHRARCFYPQLDEVNGHE